MKLEVSRTHYPRLFFLLLFSHMIFTLLLIWLGTSVGISIAKRAFGDCGSRYQAEELLLGNGSILCPLKAKSESSLPQDPKCKAG